MIGLSVRGRERIVAPDVVERFRSLPVANVSDVMNRLPAGGAALRPLHRDGVLAGPALTVRTRPGDNLMLHKAIDMATPGDVIVVDGGGDLSNALIGEMMIAYAKVRGVAGIVIYGAVRDAASIAADDFPVFAAGITHRGPFKDGPGEVNSPIAINGMVINPGDLMLGDADGVLCVPIAAAEEIYQAASVKHRAETAQLEAIAAGTNDRTWVNRALAALGCPGLDDVA